MNIFEQLSQVFNKKKSASEIGKERLMFVIVQDRNLLSPEQMNKMKGELLDILSKYYIVEQENVEINPIRTGDGKTALSLSIPVLGVRR